MPSKNKNWHTRWHIASGDPARICHDSGLCFVAETGDGHTDFIADTATLAVYQAHELARGLQLAQIAEHGMRLAKEAARFYERANKPPSKN